MSLGGISGYMQPPGISTPEDQYSIPYLPYAQQGPYQSIMSQMGDYGGSAGTGYQQGVGNVYSGGGATGGYNADLYKRASAPGASADMGGGYGGGRGGGGYEGGGGYSGMPFSYDSNSYTGGFLPALLGQQPPAPVVDTTGYNSAAQAESAQLQSLANQYGMYNNPDASSGGRGGSSDGGGAATGGRDGDASGGGDRGTRGGFAKGGHVMASMLSAPNPMGPDQGYGALKSGEFVINDKAVAKYGIELMNAINSGKISKGKLLGLLEM